MREGPVFDAWISSIASENVKVAGQRPKQVEVIDMSQTILEPSLPSEAEVNLARDAGRILASRMKEDGILQLRILNGASRDETLNLPTSALRILRMSE